jgi:hypothetical protein
MRDHSFRLARALALLAAAALGTALPVSAQPAAATTCANLPADPWPRELRLSNTAALVCQPQVHCRVGNPMDLRAALAIMSGVART